MFKNTPTPTPVEDFTYPFIRPITQRTNLFLSGSYKITPEIEEENDIICVESLSISCELENKKPIAADVFFTFLIPNEPELPEEIEADFLHGYAEAMAYIPPAEEAFPENESEPDDPFEYSDEEIEAEFPEPEPFDPPAPLTPEPTGEYIRTGEKIITGIVVNPGESKIIELPNEIILKKGELLMLHLNAAGARGFCTCSYKLLSPTPEA